MRHLMASAAFLALAVPTAAGAQTLDSFGVLAGSTVTNTGPSVIEGNIGLSPGSSIVGFPPGTVVPPYTIYQNNAVAAQAQSDLTTAYNVLAGRPFSVDLTGQDLGGLTLASGVYNFNSSAQLTGTVTLDAGGDPDAVFVFNIGSTLTTAAASSVELINGAQASNVFFRVGSSATLGATTEFQGRILALTSITLITGANVTCGAVLARNGAVTLDTNNITIPGSSICPVVAAVIGDDLDEDTPDAAVDLGEAIDDFVDGGGVLPLGFQVLAVLTPEELAEALSQIAGEAGTATAPTGMQAMDSFLNMVMAPGIDRSPAAPLQTPPPRDTVRVLGYGPETASAAGAPFASLDQPPIGAASDPRLWEIWAGVHGGYRDNDGDDGAGTHDRSSSHGGIAVGIDYRIAPDTKVGLAVGGGRTDFDLASNRGDGGSDMLQVALYARTDIDRAYVSGAVAYAYHDVSNDRYVTFAGIDHFSSDFDAHNVAAHIEAGYRFGWLIPYAALRAQAYFTPSYDEETVSGASTFALSYEDDTTTVFRTELGARVEHTIALGAETALSLRGRAAWAHDTWSDTDVDAEFQAVPGLGITVEGAEPAENLLLLTAGAELGFSNGLSLGLAFDTELAEESQTYTGTGRLRYRW
jgi:outer membrane autotransporter protein